VPVTLEHTLDTRLHEYWEPSETDRSRALKLFELRRVERGECADWAVDTWAAVGAKVAAAFRISLAMAGSYMRYALAMRERLPQVAEVFRE
jgi:hypothetical protein